MLSKNKAKFITSLHQKKYRDRENMFIAEGPKVVADLIAGGLTPVLIAFTPGYANYVTVLKNTETYEISESDLKKISTMVTPLQVLAVFEKPKTVPDSGRVGASVSLLIDGVRDPGNLGTIIRTADWFGIKHVFCSPGSVDVYNTKTVQATMGALASVVVNYTPLDELILRHKSPSFPVLGAFLSGEPIYGSPKITQGFVVMGSESHGISEKIEGLVIRRLFIPQRKPNSCGTESLNLAVATGIICSELLS